MKLTGSDHIDHDEEQQHESDEYGQSEKRETEAESAAGTAPARLGEMSLAQRAHDGFVKQQREPRIDPALDEIEGEEHRHQHAGYRRAGHAHV